VEVPQRQFLQVRVDVDPQIADHPGADRAGELVLDKGEHAAGHGDDDEAPGHRHQQVRAVPAQDGVDEDLQQPDAGGQQQRGASTGR